MGLHIVNGAEEAKFDQIGAEFILGDQYRCNPKDNAEII